jgi:hypothetical protein
VVALIVIDVAIWLWTMSGDGDVAAGKKNSSGGRSEEKKKIGQVVWGNQGIVRGSWQPAVGQVT